MKTRITNTPKRCLKFEGYIYIPENATPKVLRYYAARTPGRIVIYDEYGNKIGNKAFGFENLFEAMVIVEKERKKLVNKRTK